MDMMRIFIYKTSEKVRRHGEEAIISFSEAGGKE